MCYKTLFINIAETGCVRPIKISCILWIWKYILSPVSNKYQWSQYFCNNQTHGWFINVSVLVQLYWYMYLTVIVFHTYFYVSHLRHLLCHHFVFYSFCIRLYLKGKGTCPETSQCLSKAFGLSVSSSLSLKDVTWVMHLLYTQLTWQPSQEPFATCDNTVS